MSQAQILAKRDEYVSDLEEGMPAYSDTELYRVGFLNDKSEMIDSQTVEVILFVPISSSN